MSDSTDVTEVSFWTASRAFAELAPQVTPGVSRTYVELAALAVPASSSAHPNIKIDRLNTGFSPSVGVLTA
jgi:hypothetical protein